MSDPVDISEATFKIKDKTYKLSDLISALSSVNKLAQSQADEIKQLKALTSRKDDDAPPPDKGRGRKPVDNDDESDDEQIDLETISRSDLVKYIMKGVNKSLEAAVKPLVEKVSGTEKSLRRKEIESQLKEIEDSPEDFPYFEDLSEEIQAIIKKRPDLGLDEAYALATHHHKDKVAEIRKTRDEEDKDKDEEETQPFFGFTPTSGRSTGKKDMTQKDAAQSAWDQTVKGTPAERLLAGD